MNTVIPDVALIDNSDERAPLVLVLDCSGSMQEENKIQLLNEGLKALAADLKADPIAARCGRVLVISFGGDGNVEIMGDWTDAMDFTPPALLAGGLTPLGAAMRCALDEVESQKSQMRTAGVSYKRPIVMLLSDGESTDDWRRSPPSARTPRPRTRSTSWRSELATRPTRKRLGTSATRAH